MGVMVSGRDGAVGGAAVLSAERFDAVLFDLDGVLTETARLHAEAWRRTFDELLRLRAETSGERLERFDIEDDYRRYVDGKPRWPPASSPSDRSGPARGSHRWGSRGWSARPRPR